MNEFKKFGSDNVKLPIVISAALGGLLSGAVVYFAAKSGLKPLKKAAAVVKGGK